MNLSYSRKCFSGSTLKIIACILMFLDHIGPSLVYPYIDSILDTADYKIISFLLEFYELLRAIGRIAFPIFLFLLIEGFYHTRSKCRYFLRLLIFAIVSELPLDYALYGEISSVKQNIFFTLALCLLMLTIIKQIKNSEKLHELLKIMSLSAVICLFMYIAYRFKFDYSFYGILMAVILETFREYPLAMSAMGAVSFAWEYPAPLAFIPIYLYNGKRGCKLRFFFYAFYPAHLLLLAILRRLIIK